ncbi:MAG: cyclodeaminase/cyclohydrolase family protein [Chloroflexi bacterium]|nr:cyclodeaminase/cyclohydrolase family protein [Chloroflexota bacterium]HEV8054030.1 cyclodeaminase/cyclohydrolase family protein [Candidatus Limnocylindrales bacterium]
MEVAAGDRLSDLTLETFTSLLASEAAVPGGGSASAVAGALGSALIAMVAALSRNRPKYERYRETLERVEQAAENGRQRFLALADEDAVAYGRFMEARRLPRDTEAQATARDAAVDEAARASIAAPLAIVRLCEQVVVEAQALAGRSNLNAASDLEVGTLLLEAAARGAAANVLINVPALSDAAFGGAATAEADGLVRSIQQMAERVRETVAGGDLRDPEEA